jgi:hypothetical protein
LGPNPTICSPSSSHSSEVPTGKATILAWWDQQGDKRAPGEMIFEVNEQELIVRVVRNFDVQKREPVKGLWGWNSIHDTEIITNHQGMDSWRLSALQTVGLTLRSLPLLYLIVVWHEQSPANATLSKMSQL